MKIESSKDIFEGLNMPMPFGAHKGVKIIDLPEHYLVWWSQQGFPDTPIGRLLATSYEIQLNGLKGLFTGKQKF